MFQTSSPSRLRIWTPVFINVIFISLAATMVVDALQAALPIYIKQLGHGSSIGGLMVGIFSFSSIFPALLTGVLVDSFGCRRIMIIGGIIFTTGLLLPLLVPGMAALLIFRCLQGIGFAMLSVCTAAGASNILPPQRMGEGLGYFGIGQSLAMALGPMFGLWLIAYGAIPVWVSMGSIALLLMAASFFCFCDGNAKPVRPGTRPHFSLLKVIEKRAVLPAIMILIFCTGICGVIVFAGLYAQYHGYGNAGPFFICMAVAMLLIRFGSKLFMDKFPTLTILFPSMSLAMLAFLLLAYVPGLFVFYASGILLGTSFGVAMPLLAAFAVRLTPKKRRGAANATYYLCVKPGIWSRCIIWRHCHRYIRLPACNRFRLIDCNYTSHNRDRSLERQKILVSLI